MAKIIRTPPEIKEGESVIVVGNGPSLKGSGLGSVIDSYDHVWRFNNCAINGYEEDVGTKTTMWFTFRKNIRGELPCDTTMCRMAKARPIEGVEQTYMFPVDKRRQLKTFIQYLIRMHKGFDVRVGKMIPTSGLMAVWYLLDSCKAKKVAVAGFDHFSKQWFRNHHYWAKKGSRLPHDHDGIVEAIIFKQLSQNGQIEYVDKKYVSSATDNDSDPKYFLPKISSSKLKIICVMKSGGDYDSDDVQNLANHVKKAFKCDYDFICYSDTSSIATEPLQHDLPGWWSKLEIFRETGPCIYFDLDVYMPGDLTPLADWVLSGEKKIAMLEEWKPSWRSFTKNSTIVAWNGDYSNVLSEFNGISDRNMFRGDQEYITAKLESMGHNITHVQNIISGCYSYKRHCKDGFPEDSRFIGFHGKPRPRQLGSPYWSAEPSHGFFFIHNPKAGGLSFREAFRENGVLAWNRHSTAVEVRDKYGEEIFNKYPCYSLIRNPLERLVSAFFFAKRKGARVVTKVYPEFSDFVKNLDRLLNVGRAGSVFVPQCDFLCDENREPMVDLYPFEMIDDLWSLINKTHFSGDYQMLPHVNNTDYPDWRRMYDRETRRIASAIYSDDIVLYDKTKHRLNEREVGNERQRRRN